MKVDGTGRPRQASGDGDPNLMTRPTWMTAQALSRGLAVRKAAAGTAGREAAMVVRHVLIVDCAVDRAVRQGHGAGR